MRSSLFEFNLGKELALYEGSLGFRCMYLFRVFFLNLAEEAFCSAPTGVSLDRGRATRLLFFLQALSLAKCSLKGSEIHAYL